MTTREMVLLKLTRDQVKIGMTVLGGLREAVREQGSARRFVALAALRAALPDGFTKLSVFDAESSQDEKLALVDRAIEATA